MGLPVGGDACDADARSSFAALMPVVTGKTCPPATNAAWIYLSCGQPATSSSGRALSAKSLSATLKHVKVQLDVAPGRVAVDVDAHLVGHVFGLHLGLERRDVLFEGHQVIRARPTKALQRAETVNRLEEVALAGAIVPMNHIEVRPRRKRQLRQVPKPTGLDRNHTSGGLS